MAEVVVGRWGKALAVRLPSEIVGAAGLACGEVVEVEARNGDIVIRRSTAHAEADAREAAEEILAEAEGYSLDTESIRDLLAEGRRG